jgi:hypothetical protein
VEVRVERGGRLGIGAVLVAGSLLLAACTGAGPTGCSDVGASTGIQLVPPRVVHSNGRVFTITACLESDCHTVRAGGGRDIRAVHLVVGRDLRSSDPVQVRMVVRDDQRHAVFRGHTTVAPLKYQPNGSGCDPTAWVGAVRAHGRHTLRVQRLELG